MTANFAATKAPIPVSLLTGFLGSGKTTLLNYLVRQPDFSRTLVIINELGEISLDHLLVTHSNENLVMEMENGCICCSIRGDLARVLKDITWRFSRNGTRNFDRVIVETTGLADPAPILHTLMTDRNIATRYRLDAIMTTIDCVNGMHTLDHHPEAVKQAAVADRFILTKSDLINQRQLESLQKRLTELNPAAKQLPAINGQADLSSLFKASLFSIGQHAPDAAGWLSEESYNKENKLDSSETDRRYQIINTTTARTVSFPERLITPQSEGNRHDDRIHAYCFTFDDPIDPDLFDQWLDLLMAVKGSSLLRIKGMLNMKNRAGPLIIHGVQHIFHPPVELAAWPSEDRRTRIVFITHDVPRSVIENTFIPLISPEKSSAATLDA